MLLTANIQPQQVAEEPFPLLIVKNVLPDYVLAEVKAALPALEVLLQGRAFTSNQRFNYSASAVAENTALASIVKELVRDHLSQSFLDDIVRLFGSHIRGAYPNFEAEYGPLTALKAGIRGRDNDHESHILLDCQIAFNTPVEIGGTTVRGPHVDDPRKLFVGLFYLRLDGDESRGGDLEIYRSRVMPPKLDLTRTAGLADMEVVETVKYEANTLVLFLNTPDSLHGVRPRSRTPHHRVFLNLLGEMRHPLFEIVPARDCLYGASITGGARVTGVDYAEYGIAPERRASEPGIVSATELGPGLLSKVKSLFGF
jgi:hypothetical protein